MDVPYTTRVARLLWSVDAKSVGRDSLLRWILVLPVPLALAIRWLFPQLVTRLEQTLQLDLLPHYAPLMGVAMLLICPTLAGMVVGFLLLDQRDDRTMTAMSVTPLPLRGYLAHRLAAPVAASFVLSLAILPLAGLAPNGALTLVAIALGAAPIAPLFALSLAALAENKVQGLVLVKASSLISMAPVAAYFLPPAWQWPLGLAPTFWPAKAYWLALAGDPSYAVFLLAGATYSALLTLLLARRLTTILHR
jgi:fluoroquinolone transport system permease protein